jgi:hypothetical protein
MKDLDMIEMVCDMTAMAQEYSKSIKASCKGYVDENINRKWGFSENKKKQLYKIIEEIDKRLNK